jgi:hypothetical protein
MRKFMELVSMPLTVDPWALITPPLPWQPVFGEPVPAQVIPRFLCIDEPFHEEAIVALAT